MLRYLRLVSVGVAFALSLVLEAKPFAQENSDLKADPTVQFGELPNGMRYALKVNAEPKGRAALRLLIEAGSFMETEEQRGIAHFLEHMSFNGSTHYAPGTLIEFFQRMGMNFGGDTNAYTSFDHTVYQIDLPDTKEATLEEGFRVFSDYAGGLLLLAPEIEKERGVILSEKRARDSVDFRTLEAEFAFAYPKTLLPSRLPIGTEAVITNAGREQFVDFYDTWYRPELMTVVAVGDFDPAVVERLIKSSFSEVADRAPARPTPSAGSVESGVSLEVGYHYEAEAPYTRVTLRHLQPYSQFTYKAADLIERLPRDLAVSMLNQRLAELAKKEGAPFMMARMSIGSGYGILEEGTLTVYCKPEQWESAVAVAEQELRRALSHGFGDEEYKVAAANMRNALEQAVKTEATRRSAAIADQLIDSVQGEQVYTSSHADLELLAPALSHFGAKECGAALAAFWSKPGRSLFLSGNCKLDGDPTELVSKAYNKSSAQAVEAPERHAAQAWAYTNFGEAGTVVDRRVESDLGITQLRFSNGLQLNLKKTDFEAGQIGVIVRTGWGSHTEAAGQEGLTVLAENFFFTGGLGKYSSDELRRVLAGRNVGMGFDIKEDGFVFGGRTTPDDLELQLQLFSAALTDAGYRPELQRQAEKMLGQYYTRLEHVVQGPMQLEVPRILASGDHRFGLPSREVMMQRSIAEMKAWLESQFLTTPLEVSIVGDIDVEKTIALVGKTLGALKRGESPAPSEALRAIVCPAEGMEKRFEIETKIDKALVTVFWPTQTDDAQYQRSRRLRLLADIFSDRLRVKVREELGESYSPDVSQSGSSTYRNYGFLEASLLVNPAKAKRLEEVVLAIAEELRTQGVTEDERTRVLLPALTGIKESVRTNGYWLGSVLDGLSKKPWKLEAARSRTLDTEAITCAELNALATEVLVPAKAFRFTVLPKAPQQ